MRSSIRIAHVMLCVLLLTALAACGGSGSLQGGLSAHQPALGNLPQFPGSVVPEGAMKVTAAYNNIQLGRQVWNDSATGATINGNKLELTSSAGNFSWGIFAWGAFNTGIQPLEIQLDVLPGTPGEFWLLLSNYDTEKWDILGPLDGSVTSFLYTAGTNYVSPTGYSYVALIGEGGNGLTVNSLTLVCDQDFNPPAAPANLRCTDLQFDRASLLWGVNTEPDLNHYHVYMGPADGFQLDDPGVVQLGTVNKPMHDYLALGLSAETDYYFRVTATDAAGNESDPSNTVHVTTPAAPVYPPPYNVTVNDFGGYWADVSWENGSDPAPIGYDVYVGPSADFVIGGPSVIKCNVALIMPKSFHILGLTSGTEYFVKVRTFYSNWSALSEPANFTTEQSTPPVPDFEAAQSGSYYLAAGEPVSFNPSATSDPDTPVSELYFSWDFNNDSIADTSTVGPTIVYHTFNQHGTFPVTLTVSDGTAVSITKDLVISYSYDYQTLGSGIYSGETAQAVATHPGDSRIAVLLASNKVRYFDGTSWSTIPITGITDPIVMDVALSQTGLHILVLEFASPNLRWTIYNWDGMAWNADETDTMPGTSYQQVHLRYAENGLISISAMIGVTTSPTNTRKDFNYWHQKADLSFRKDTVVVGNNIMAAGDVQRNDDTSYFVYSVNNNIRLITVTDASSSDSIEQSTSGAATMLNVGLAPSDDTHAAWVAASPGGVLYYGDNYGSGNGGSQSYTPAVAPAALLGVYPVADNEARLYWTSGPVSAMQAIMGYDTSVGSPGTEFTLDSGLGCANGGAGAVYDYNSNAGIYAAVKEQRDAEVTGLVINAQTIASSETVSFPTGGGEIGMTHAALAFADGKLASLSEEPIANALAGFSPQLGMSFAAEQTGLDSACRPDSACITTQAGEYFIAGYPFGASLIVNRFQQGSGDSLGEDTFSNAALGKLCFNPTTSEVALFYAANSLQDVAMRTWDGSAWSAEETVYAGSADVLQLAVAPHATGWGVLLLDNANNLKLVESDAGTWGLASDVGTDTHNPLSGVALAYNSVGDCVAAYESQGVPSAVIAARRPFGGVTWDLQPAILTTGDEARSIRVSYAGTYPALVYYHPEIVANLSRIWITEETAGGWVTSQLPEQLHGAPFGFAVDPTGNIVLSGRDMTSTPYDSVVAVLHFGS